MRIDRRLVLIGVMLIVLSMTMATQYATTKVGYSFAIVHPSNADIRFIACDNSSDTNMRVLRVSNNASGYQTMTVELGDWAPNQRKNYTAAFAIVNEEPFKVNITYINITGTNASYLDIWLHGDRDVDYPNDGTAVMVVQNGAAQYDQNSVVWTLGVGDGDTSTMDDDPSGGGTIATTWDSTANVQYSTSDTDATNETSDFVWVGITLDLIGETAGMGTPTGSIFIHFKSTTFDDET
jgi:hypothetical protein